MMEEYFYIKSLGKAIDILDLLAKSGDLSVSEIGKKLGMHRSAVHRFLATMNSLGLLDQAEDSRYRLSLRLFEWGMAAANRLEVRQVARPFLVDLKNKHEETANLAIMEGESVIYVDKVESPHLLRMDLAIGRQVPSYCTGLGKVLLAHRDEKEIRKFLRGAKLESRTPKTIVDVPELIKQLSKIREEGYALDDEELVEGIRCIAVPVFDYTKNCIASISVAGPSVRMTDQKIELIKRDILIVGKVISMRLGLTD